MWLMVAKCVHNKEILRRKHIYEPVGTFTCCLRKFIVWRSCWIFGVVSMRHRLCSDIYAILIKILIVRFHLQYITFQTLSESFRIRW